MHPVAASISLAWPTVSPVTAVKVGLFRSGGFKFSLARYASVSPLPAIPSDALVAFPVAAPKSVLKQIT